MDDSAYRGGGAGSDAVRHQQDEQNKDDEKHNRPTRIAAEDSVHRISLLMF